MDTQKAERNSDPIEYTCPYCGHMPVYASGAVATGDGDVYDEACCDACQECFPIPGSRIWYDDEGHAYYSFEEWAAFGVFDEPSDPHEPYGMWG